MTFDLLIIGGGINGCGLARDAAGRGLSVALFEKGDLAGGTSSASTKLIHGGLRYLEYFEFRLVREALAERETLLAIAPHIIRPMRFVLPHHEGLRPAWMLRLGLFVYDHLGGRRLLPATRGLDLRGDPAGAPLENPGARAFEYSDCRADDARLVTLNAVDAAERGALIETRARVVSAKRDGGIWRGRIESNGGAREVEARVIVNAAGPWAGDVLEGVLGQRSGAKLRLVQGSHIVVPKLYDHDRGYIFQNADGRIVFAIPFEGDFTLIGTTDRDWSGPPENVSASAEEIDYLCAAANEYFRRKITPADAVWSYSGVRALRDGGGAKAQAASRDYFLELDRGPDGAGAPVLSIFGGKITTYRRMAERALEALAHCLPKAGAPAWTAGAPLPGGDFAVDGFEALLARLRAGHSYLDPTTARRLAGAYGTRAFALLEGITSGAGLGVHFGAGLYEAEVVWLMERERAFSADDVLWRRSKLGLRLSAAETARLGEWMAAAAKR